MHCDIVIFAEYGYITGACIYIQSILRPEIDLFVLSGRGAEEVNILLMNHYAGSTEMGMEFRPYYFAREWIKMGHQVTIIAGDYSHLRIRNPVVNKDFQKEVIDGIEYYWVRTGRYKGNGVKRAMTMFRFVYKLWANAKRIADSVKPDVVITSSTYPFDTFAGQKIAKLYGSRLIHEVHDMWPATLIELGGMKKYNPFVMLMQISENSSYRKSDYVVSVLPCAKGYMIKHGMKEEKFVNIQNGIVLSEWEKQEKIPKKHHEILSRLKENGYFIVGYFGGHALSNALDLLLDTAKGISIPNIKFVLVGNGAEKPRLIKRVQDEKIENVILLEPVGKASVGDLTRYFDCSYMGSLKSPLYRFGISFNKMYDSMMAGKPIVCAIDAPECPVEKYNCGIVVKSGKPSEIQSAIEQIYAMPENKKKEMSLRGREAILKHYNYMILAKQFEDLFKK